jgi:hypothetical protein
MTLHAQSLVLTDRPARYAAQLAKHFGHKRTAEWSAEGGFIEFEDGRCEMHSWPEGLRLDAFAPTPEGLEHVEHVVKRHLERWGEKDDIRVEWTRRPLAEA